MSNEYDVLVIGSGTAGQTAAYELKREGTKVGLIEHRGRPGGTCALAGCQAKKWFYEGAETVARSHHLKGIGIHSTASANWQQLRDAKNRFTVNVPNNTLDGLKKAGIDFIPGRAQFADYHSLFVNDHQVSARFIVLATGAVPMNLPFDGAELIATSSEFMELSQLPRRIVFIGGGFISFEFAHFAARLGREGTHCTILESGSRPLGPFDQEMVELLVDASMKEQISVQCDVDIVSIEKSATAFILTTKDDSRFEANLVVHGAGRAPNVDDLNLDRADVRHTRRGITVDEKMTTTSPHIYAVGDCAATIQLARVADMEAQVAATDILHRMGINRSEPSMDYTAIPAVLFTYPQYGMVGATEEKLKKEGMAYRKSFAKELTWPTYKRVGMKSAAYKLLVGEDGMLLGAHVLSDNTTGLINTFTLAMVNKISAEELYRQSILTPYPSRESDIIYMIRPLLS